MKRRGSMARRNRKKCKVVKVDPLSALPDAMLHQIMSRAGIRAWEMARTCVLSRRWRHVWASSPCVDLRAFYSYKHRPPPKNFAKFVDGFLSRRDKEATLDTIRLVHAECEHPGMYDDEHQQPTYDSCDVARWLTAAIQRRARVIELYDHPEHPGLCFELDDVSVASTHLQQLKLSFARLGARTLNGLSSECPSLQVLELRDCVLEGSRNNISSASLKSLTVENCRITVDLSVTAPNLVSLRCVKPYNRAPSFSTMGSLATATIILVDSFLTTVGDQLKEVHDDFPLTLSYSGDNASYLYDDVYGGDADSISTCQYGELANDCDDEQSSADSKDRSIKGNSSILGGYHRPTVFGGDKLLQSLSSATSLDLIAHLGEVILNRELKTCPTYCNLKTLFLGEWCMADDFAPLVFFLDHCPNLERLSVELKSGNDKAEAMSDKNRLAGTLLACAHLAMVKIIKCCKDDARVDALVQLFVDSGMDIKKIYVRQTRKNCLLTSSTEVAL